MQKVINDCDFGLVIMRKNYRSRAYTIRLRGKSVSISLPYTGTYQTALDILDKHRLQLLSQITQCPSVEPPEYDEQDLRNKASAYLPDRLKELAGIHGFAFRQIKISSSRGRWGSCSSKLNINLSFFLMLLPKHLIDYVILHELCHTREMNHGAAFWLLMDEVTGGKAAQLRRELKSRNIPRSSC